MAMLFLGSVVIANAQNRRQTIALRSSTRQPRRAVDGAAQPGCDSHTGPVSLAKIVAFRKKPLSVLNSLSTRISPAISSSGCMNIRSTRRCSRCPWMAGIRQMPILRDEPFWFACPPRHRLAQLKGILRGGFARDEPMLLLADGHCLRGRATCRLRANRGGNWRRESARRAPRRERGWRRRANLLRRLSRRRLCTWPEHSTRPGYAGGSLNGD